MANQFIQSISGPLIRYRARIAQFGIGLAIFETVNHLYDFVFFPFALAQWGALWGAIVATMGALILNVFVYWLYEVMKIDWLQAYATSELADKDTQTQYEKLITWFRKEKRTPREKILGIALFVGLTLPLDPVLVAVYYRKSYFAGISLRDWGVLLASTLSACVLWLLVLEPGVLVAKVIFHAIHLWIASF